jgi:nucleotide-binding universal stress UspA family protein
LIWFSNPPNWTLWNCTVWLASAANPAILATMRHRPRSPGHTDPIRPRLLVIGGYGHTRLWEALLGGFTRHALAGAEIPVLMVH